METQALKAEVRKESGKGSARRLRARGLIPGVFYGPGAEPVPLAVSPKSLLKVLDSPHGKNTVLSLDLGPDRRSMALVKEIDVHPVTYDPIHVDFYHVALDRTVDVEVPFRTKGRAAGVQKGGTLHVTLRSLPVRATPDRIPAAIELDVTRLEVNDVVRVGDLELPEGVTVLRAPERTLVTIMSEERKASVAEEPGAAPGEPAAAGKS